MPKLRKKATHDFTVISNKIFRDKRLKAIDRGILGTMLSLADGWNFSIKGLSAIMPDGETAIAHSLKRIEKAHYLFRKRIYKNGKISDWDYIIDDEPMDDLFTEEEIRKAKKLDTSAEAETVENQPIFLPNLDVDSLDVENHDVEKQDVENSHDNKIKKNKISKNKISVDEVSINHSAKNPQNFQQSTESSIDRIDRLQERKEKRANAEWYVKSNIEYDWYEDFFANKLDNSMDRGKVTYASNMAEIDMIVSIIVNTICSESQYIRIGKQDMCHSVVESVFKKLEMKHIEYALKCLMLNTKDVKNPIAYLTTVLYNASLTCDFAENNELKNLDPAMFIPEQFHNEDFQEKHYGHTAYCPVRHSDSSFGDMWE